MQKPIALVTVVLDCLDIEALSDFYVRMLGWKRKSAFADWIDTQHPDGGIKIGFQQDLEYVPPAWPESPPAQQQMAHLDFSVFSKAEMEEAVARAMACGARKAETQYDERWTVMIDPAGHPFCFVLW